jgi:hypothetical protein
LFRRVDHQKEQDAMHTEKLSQLNLLI